MGGKDARNKAGARRRTDGQKDSVTLRGEERRRSCVCTFVANSSLGRLTAGGPAGLRACEFLESCMGHGVAMSKQLMETRKEGWLGVQGGGGGFQAGHGGV